MTAIAVTPVGVTFEFGLTLLSLRKLYSGE